MRKLTIFTMAIVLAMVSLLSTSFSEGVIDQFKFGMTLEETQNLASELVRKGLIKMGGIYKSLTGEVQAFGFDLLEDEYGLEYPQDNYITLNFSYGVLVAIQYHDQIYDAKKTKPKYDERSKKLQKILGSPDFSNKTKDSARITNPINTLYIITGDYETKDGDTTIKTKVNKYEQWLVKDKDGTVRLFHHAEYVMSRSDYKDVGWPKEFLFEYLTIVKYE